MRFFRNNDENVDGNGTVNNSQRKLVLSILNALQDEKFDEEVLFDLKHENQHLTNRTLTLLIKYIIKREVDKFRVRRTEALRRKVYSNLIMKLIDIAKDIQRNQSTVDRIEKAHKYFNLVENSDVHDVMADNQVFHYVARLYEVILTAPKIFHHLGDISMLTTKILTRKLKTVDVKPVHLGVAILIQYYLKSLVNFAIESNAMKVLSTKPQAITGQVVDVVKAFASRLLPVAELLDIHLSHSSALFSSECPSTWLGIVNKEKHVT